MHRTIPGASLLLSVLLLAAAACGGTSDETTDATTTTSFVPGTLATEFVTSYRADALGFATDFPIDWRVEDESDLGVVTFIAPQQPGDTFIENFTVAVSTVPDGFTLEDAARFDATRIQSTVDDFTVTGGGSTSLGGVPAVSVLYEGSLEGVPLAFLHVLALEGGTIYDVTFSASEPEFENFLPVIEQMLSGFTFTG